MHHYITPALHRTLFAGHPGDDATFVGITEPVTIDDAGIEVLGITFGAVRFVVFFADLLRYADGDPVWVQETADEWADGYQPAAQATMARAGTP
jgi:hypothetical protein